MSTMITICLLFNVYFVVPMNLVSDQFEQDGPCLFNCSSQQECCSSLIERIEVSGESLERPISGTWQLEWNDDINTQPQDFEKSCTIEFQEIAGVINGKFVGPVAGRERLAIISGRVEGQGNRILTFQQREDGYVCSYQAFDNGGAILGVWHDTENRSGRFRLLKYQ